MSAPQPHLHIPGTNDGSISGGDVLTVDLVMLQRAITAADEAAAAAGSLADTLTSRVHASGPAPWGDDPALGQTFGSVFAEPREILVQAVQGMPQVLRNIADNLAAMDRSYRGAEEAAIAAAQSVSGYAKTGSREW
ncbi:hypothetical protein [Actinacidiphila glaucinigra]|uniref:hypothetical protein n=1 Tax=Actinacidiphila glaucinigra TaxID=235986 RepID=UPI0035D681A8